MENQKLCKVLPFESNFERQINVLIKQKRRILGIGRRVSKACTLKKRAGAESCEEFCRQKRTISLRTRRVGSIENQSQGGE